MFAVIYRFKLKSHQEERYIQNWNTVAQYFIDHKGAIGSCLHKGEDALWVAYSRWPDKKTRDKSWPKDRSINENFPREIQQAIRDMLAIQEENSEFEQFDEICLDVIHDKLIS